MGYNRTIGKSVGNANNLLKIQEEEGRGGSKAPGDNEQVGLN